jgi:phosphoglycolate phosphatase-like HAD superfamily hydrolase
MQTMRPTRQPLFLFDIDGTLLRGDGAGRRAMMAAFAQTFGDPRGFDGLGFGGLTDRRIIRLAAANRGVDVDDAAIDAILARYAIAMAAECERGTPFEPIQSACVVARHLSLRHPGAMGLGTGNIAAVAHLKVAAVGLGGLFGFGGFGDDAEDRAEMLAIGVARGLARLGLGRTDVRPIVVGDTVRDVVAARAVGLDVVTVATGYEDPHALIAADADAHFEWLDAERFDAWLGANT